MQHYIKETIRIIDFYVSFRWKEECNTITQKFETKVNDLRTEISRQKRRIEELTKLLRESKDKNIEVRQSGHNVI